MSSKFLSTFSRIGQHLSRPISTFSSLRSKSPKIGNVEKLSHAHSRRRSKSNRRNPIFGKNFISGVEEFKSPHNPRRALRPPPEIKGHPLPDEILLEIKELQLEKAFGLPKLSPADCLRRIEFATTFLDLMAKDPLILDSIFFSDEGNFWPLATGPGGSTRKSKRRNKSRIYAESEPLPTIVWCALNRKEVIGPYFFNSHVTDRSYIKMLDKYFLKQVEKQGYARDRIWFQQDGAPPHRSRQTLDFVGQVFGHRLVSNGVTPPAIPWPPRSQDLTPLDYFLWDYLQIRMTPYSPTTPENLRECLTTEIQTIDSTLLKTEVEDLRRRLEKCLEANGGRFEP